MKPLEGSPSGSPASHSLSPELARSIRTQVARDLRPARGLEPGVRFWLGLSAFLLTLLAVASTSSSPLHLAAPRALTLLSSGMVLLGGACFFMLLRARSFRTSAIGRMVALGLPLATFGIELWLGYLWLPSQPYPEVPSTFAAAHCALEGTLIAAAPLALLVLLWRKTDPFTPRVTGAGVGGWAGFVGALALSLACPAGGWFHLIVGHGTPVLAGMILGALAAPRFLRP